MSTSDSPVRPVRAARCRSKRVAVSRGPSRTPEGVFKATPDAATADKSSRISCKIYGGHQRLRRVRRTSGARLRRPPVRRKCSPEILSKDVVERISSKALQSLLASGFNKFASSSPASPSNISSGSNASSGSRGVRRSRQMHPHRLLSSEESHPPVQPRSSVLSNKAGSRPPCCVCRDNFPRYSLGGMQRNYCDQHVSEYDDQSASPVSAQRQRDSDSNINA